VKNVVKDIPLAQFKPVTYTYVNLYGTLYRNENRSKSRNMNGYVNRNMNGNRNRNIKMNMLRT
jgi:hypothetical protein